MDTVSETRTLAAAQLAAEIGDLLTVAETAGILRVTKTTIYGLVASGELGDVVRIGRAIRIPANHVRAYLVTPAAA